MKFDFEGEEWKNVSEGAKSLIKKMICPSTKRLTAMEVIMDTWC